MKRYPAESLRHAASDIFAEYDAPPEEAAIVAEQLVAGNLMGLDSHGIIRVPQYVGWIANGTIKPGAPMSISSEDGGKDLIGKMIGYMKSAPPAPVSTRFCCQESWTGGSSRRGGHKASR
jgi:LDH2 family malate/lactate/ureidoglycolate dehydrogenase